MKSSAVVETLVIAKHDERGRRIADAPEKQALLEAFATSGMTQEAFARREGINRFTLATWLRKKRQEALKQEPGSPQRFVELGLPRSAASGFCLEVVLPDGLIVRGREAKQLVAFVQGLR
jgi:transposase-like protein